MKAQFCAAAPRDVALLLGFAPVCVGRVVGCYAFWRERVSIYEVVFEQQQQRRCKAGVASELHALRAVLWALEMARTQAVILHCIFIFLIMPRIERLWGGA